MFLPLIQGILAPQVTTACSLNRQYSEDKETFPEFAKKVLSDFTVSNFVWESLNDDVKIELLKLGYKPESSK